jgi:hypothetical protein
MEHGFTHQAHGHAGKNEVGLIIQQAGLAVYVDKLEKLFGQL